jgi:hypothetical protein
MASSTQVPGLDGATPQLSQNVPGVQFPFRQEFGREGAAYEHLGESIEGAAHTGAEIYDEIQRQHDISTSSLAFTQATVRHAQMRDDIAMSSPDGLVHDPDNNEVLQNPDGSQKTIAQQYWDHADKDYQDTQQGMTPRAAAMFRQVMQKDISENTQKLQNEGMRLQAQNSDQKLQQIKDTYSKDFDRSFVPSANPYYTGSMQDGTTREYPSAQKFFDAIQNTQLTRQQMGPIQGKNGLYGPSEVEALKKGDGQELANNWLTSAKQDLMEINGSRAALHNQLKDASSTSSMQIRSLMDIVNGRDPESMRRAGRKLPTINSALSPDQIHHWNEALLGMIPAAKSVDKSEYELQKNQLTESAKSAQSLDQFFGSPLFQKTTLMGSGIGLTDAERVKDLAPIVSQAVTSVALSSVGGISSTDAKRQAATAVLKDAEKRWPQLAGMIGEKNTDGFGQAITSEANKQVAAKLQEDASQMKSDPMKYMAGIKEGPQGPGGTPAYKSPMAHAIEERLDPRKDPSIFSIFKPMSGGKSVMESAQATANNGYARMFNSKSDVSILQEDQFKDQASRLKNANDPHLITSYFNQLNQQRLTPAEKENYINDLVHKGGLPQTYVDALNLTTPTEREAVWAKLLSKPAELPEGLSQKQLDQSFSEHNKALAAYEDRKYGPNSSFSRTMMDTYRHSWQEDVKQAMHRGMQETDAYAYADDQRDKTTGAIGTVGAQHDFFGTGLIHWGTVGPQVPVEYGSNKFNDAQKQKINDSLLYAQSKDTLKNYHIAPAPGQLPLNDNAPTDASRVASTASFWRRVGHAWRLQTMEMDSNNRPTGNSQDVWVYGKDTQAHPYEVSEDSALAGPPADFKQHAVPSVKKSTDPQVGGMRLGESKF